MIVSTRGRGLNPLYQRAGMLSKRSFSAPLRPSDSISAYTTYPHPLVKDVTSILRINIPKKNDTIHGARNFSSGNDVQSSPSNKYQLELSEIELMQSKVDQLKVETADELSRIINESPTEIGKESKPAILDLIDKWYEITSSITLPKTQRKRKRFIDTSTHTELSYITTTKKTSYGSDDAIQTLKDIKITCAENLDKLIHHYIKNPNTPLVAKKAFFGFISKGEEPNTRPFTLVMEAWNQSTAPESGQKAAETLEAWGELYGGDVANAPTKHDFAIVLDALAKCSSGDYNLYEKDSSFPAESAWDLFTILSGLNDPSLLPNITMCSHLVHSLSNHAFVMRYAKRPFDTKMNSEVAGIRAYFAWKQMMQMVSRKKSYEDNELELIWRAHKDILNLSSVSMLRRDDQDDIIEDKINKGSDLMFNVGSDTEELLVRLLQMQGMNNGNDEVMEYLCQSFSSTMGAWIREQECRIQSAKDKNGGQKDDLLEGIIHAARSTVMLLDVMKEQGIKIRPDHYHLSIQAATNCLNDAVLSINHNDEVKEILPRVKSLFAELENDFLNDIAKNPFVTTQEKMDASIYRLVLDCYYRNMNFRGAHKGDIKEVAKMVQRMLYLYENDMLLFHGDHMTVALNRALKIISENRPTNEDVITASEILERFRSLPIKGSQDTKLAQYNPRPDQVSYRLYLTILSRSRSNDAALEVMETLKHMNRDKMNVGSEHYSAAINCLVKSRKGEHKLKARDLLFEAIKGYNELSSKEKEASKFNAAALYASMISPAKSSEAISLLMTLEKEYARTSDRHLKPNLILYSSVLRAIASDRKRAQWKNEKALEIYRSIDDMYTEGDAEMMPNKYCCTSILQVLSKSEFEDATDIAQGILERMDELYIKTGDRDVQPDSRLFFALMKIWASSNREFKARQAWMLCQEMENRYKKDGNPSMKPTIVYLNIVLHACAYTMDASERKEAFIVAEEVQRIISDNKVYGTADSTSYNNIMKVYYFLLKDPSQKKEREDGISAAFGTCCQEGLLDEKVLKSLGRFFPLFFKKLPGYSNGRVTVDDLPEVWSRNARHRKKGRTGSSGR